jgi:hypothetical protein
LHSQLSNCTPEADALQGRKHLRCALTPMCSSRPPGLSASVRIISPSSIVSFSLVIFCLQDAPMTQI